MVTGGLLHHHLHPRPPLHLADSPYLLCRRSALNRPSFPPKRYAASQRGLLQPPLTSIQCVKQEEQAGSDVEVVEWVNKAARDPMVEVDPVTVFRRIVAERRAIAAMAKAKEEEANLALQTTSPPPILGSKWPGNPAIAIATALVLLAMAAALYFLRSRKDRYEAMELTSEDAKGTLESSINGRRKLVKDTIKAPDSVLTAMAIGAASVSRPKGHVGSTHDTLHASNGNVVESQRPQGATDFYPIVNTAAVEDMESDLHGKPTFGQTPYSSSMVEEFTPLKVENDGIDITEGAWFGQGEMLAPVEVEELESEKSPLAELEELEAEDVLIESQTLSLSNETTALPAMEQLVSEISVGGEVGFEAPVFTGVADGEFHGEVVAFSDQPNHSNVQVVLEFKVEESQIDGVLAVSSTTCEKLEQIIKEDSITSLEAKDAADDTDCPEQSTEIASSAPGLPNGQFDETNSESDDDKDGNFKHYGVEESFTPTQDDSVTSLEANDIKSSFDEVQVAEGYLLVRNSDSLSIKEQENVTNLLSYVDQTLEQTETQLDDVLDGVSSSANAFHMGQIEEDEGLMIETRKESLTDSSASLGPIDSQNTDRVADCSPVDAAVQASEEDPREDSKKALEAAVPAIAVGVGTVGALFGVAGGLQVVGFVALASLLSQDFLWAQSRESLWQELNGITDRQKLLDFLTKRNIMRTEQQK